MIWTHNLNPEIIHIWKNIAIRWYSLAYFLAFVIAIFWFNYLVKNNYLNLNTKEKEDLLFYLFLGVVVGGRFFYFIFYHTELIINDPLEILRFWHGGMSFHGGFIGVLIGTYIFAKQYNKNLWKLFGAEGMIAPVGLFFGRLGNFINGELWGKPTNGEWGIIFPGAGPLPRHPSQLYEAFTEGILLFLILLVIFKVRKNLYYLGPLFGIGYSTFRFIVEYFREPDRHMGNIFLNSLSMGQILSFLMLVFSVIVLIFISKKNRRKNV